MIGHLWLILGFWLVAVAASGAPLPRIAIIIDDLGYQLEAGHRTIDLPGPVACAILPSTPRATSLAEAAFSTLPDLEGSRCCASLLSIWPGNRLSTFS